MENATKALLIAAAVLVAILIISLGLVVYNMAAETMGNVNLNEQEVQAHNDQFTRYLGEAQRGSQVNALLQAAFNNNLDETDAGKKVTVILKSGGTDTNLVLPTQTSSPTKVDTGATYKVTATYDAESKLITIITVQKNTGTPAGNTTP